MGWIWLVVFAAASIIALKMLGVSRAMLTLCAAALFIGAAGYALQQNAALPGSPVSAQTKEIDQDPGLLAFRQAIMPVTPANRVTLGAVDFRLGNGDTTGAAQLLLAAIAKQPGDAALWTRLGSVLADHDGGQVSPGAQYAFRRAVELAPNAPGPPFFLGMALVQGGDLPAAKQAWLRALALAPRDAPYRVDIAERLVLVDQFMAMQAAAERAQKAR